MASPFAGTQFTVLNLTGQADSNVEYSVPAWVIVKTWNTFGVPVSLLWSTLFPRVMRVRSAEERFFDENAVLNIACYACSLPFYLVSDTILFPYDGYLFYNARCEAEYFPEDGDFSGILQ